MKRHVLFLTLALGAAALLAGCPGLGSWSEALDGYQRRLPIEVDAGPSLFPLDARCGANADCESGQCREGVCSSAFSPGAGLPCGDGDDCQAGDVCEPFGSQREYRCVTPTAGACAPIGRLCKVNGDCGGLACSNRCDEGICRAASCGRENATCGTHQDCCTGWLCSGADAGTGQGTCLPSAPSSLEAGWVCTAPAQCVTGGCTTTDPRVCIQASSCSKAGSNGCSPGCCTGLTCQNSTCCAVNQKACVSDGECCSGQCLGGFCLDAKVIDGASQHDNCRMLDQVCGDDNDCCTGLCDATLKQCKLDPTLVDGGTCVVDIRTKRCAVDAGTASPVLCGTATASCQSSADCCNGASCTASSQSCF